MYQISFVSVSNYLNINIFKHGCCDERKKGDEGEFTVYCTLFTPKSVSIVQSY